MFQNCILKIKRNFNKQFDDVYNFKVQEIRRINERNRRITKILNDMESEEEHPEMMGLSIVEEPERYLSVTDDEVKVEKYFSEEERKRLEEEAALQGTVK